MTQSERDFVGKTLLQLAVYYGKQITKEVISMMVDDLECLTPLEIQAAIANYRRDPKNRLFPLPAQLIAIAKPQVDPDSAAKEIAARITAAIPKFGWNNSQEARAYVGEVGWRVIQDQGGWSYVCEHLGKTINPSAFQAQVRELSKSRLQHNDQAMSNAIGLKSEHQLNRLVSSIPNLLKPVDGGT